MISVNLTTAVAAIGSLIFVVLSALVGLLIRSVRRQTKVDMMLGEVTADLKELVESKDKIHAAMYDQMRVDREATDRRLRFMEEYFMRHSMGRSEHQ